MPSRPNSAHFRNTNFELSAIKSLHPTLTFKRPRTVFCAPAIWRKHGLNWCKKEIAFYYTSYLKPWIVLFDRFISQLKDLLTLNMFLFVFSQNVISFSRGH